MLKAILYLPQLFFIKLARSRVFFVGFVFAVLFGAIVVRLFRLQVLGGKQYLDEYKQSINVSPAGTYIITTETNESYVFFVVPESMIINKATMNGFDFPLDSPQEVTIDYKSYKVYRSSSTYDAGILTIIIS